MNFCDLSPRVVPSPLANHLSSVLKYLAYGHLILGILYIIGGWDYVGMAILDFLLSWIAYASYRTLSYRYITFYIWLLAINTINLIVYFGTYIEYSSKYYNEMKATYIYLLCLISIAIIFYCFAIYTAYKSYKEFKALAINSLSNQHSCTNNINNRPTTKRGP